jgi:hypothetical protein
LRCWFLLILLVLLVPSQGQAQCLPEGWRARGGGLSVSGRTACASIILDLDPVLLAHLGLPVTARVHSPSPHLAAADDSCVALPFADCVCVCICCICCCCPSLFLLSRIPAALLDLAANGRLRFETQTRTRCIPLIVRGFFQRDGQTPPPAADTPASGNTSPPRCALVAGAFACRRLLCGCRVHRQRFSPGTANHRPGRTPNYRRDY